MAANVMRQKIYLTALCVLLAAFSRIQGSALAASSLAPTIADLAYGKESEQQKLDFFRADASKPTPVVFMIHGGGWMQGDKQDYEQKTIVPFLHAGISVIRINCRLIDTAMQEKVPPPVKASLMDAALALQTARLNCKQWNVDPDRIGATGISAGGCTSL